MSVIVTETLRVMVGPLACTEIVEVNHDTVSPFERPQGDTLIEQHLSAAHRLHPSIHLHPLLS